MSHYFFKQSEVVTLISTASSSLTKVKKTTQAFCHICTKAK